MRIGIIGINHKLATLALRESLVKHSFSQLQAHHALPLHYIYLATCNRVEIYYSSPDLVATHSLLLQLFCERIEEEIAHKLYSYFGEDCFIHLAKVTAGLDSALLLETEIQGQVKRAYQQAALERLLSSELHYIFQKSLAIGKKIRAKFPLSAKIPSLEETIKNLLGSLSNKRVLFVGISEINCKIASYLQERGAAEIVFCNRSLTKRAALHREFALMELTHLTHWHRYDMTIFGTTSLEYLLDEGSAPDEKRLLIDLSVPRNVHPRVGTLSNVTLLNIDQIHKLIERKRRGEVQQLIRAESEEITQRVELYVDAFERKYIP